MKLWTTKGPGSQEDVNESEKPTPRVFDYFDVTALGIGSSLAVGVSVLIGELSKNARGPAVVISVLLAGVAALFAGLCFAEFGVRFLKGNSAYSFCYAGCRENGAFIFGWALILQYVAGGASVARGIITFIDALTDEKISNLLKETTWTNPESIFPYFDFFSLILIVLVVAAILAFGAKDITKVRNAFTCCNIAVVVCVIVAGSFKADIKNWKIEVGDTPEGELAPFDVLPITRAAAIAFYGYIGFDIIGISGSEVKRRKRNLPLAVLVTILLTLLAYAGTAAVITLMCPYSLINPNAAVPFAFEHVGWTTSKWVVAVAAFFGFTTSLFGASFPLQGVISSMANDGLLFHCLGNTPVVAIIVGGVVTSTAAAVFAFGNLVTLTVIATLFAHTYTAINVILLRYSPKNENDEQPDNHWINGFNQSSVVWMKKMAQNWFSSKEQMPTNLTLKVVQGNLIVFCLSSVCFGAIFVYLSESLLKAKVEAVVPASLLVVIMLLNLISLTCQPKSKNFLPFEVPVVPFVPCLSIFLNIFLMLTLESVTWILFSGWMAVGIVPHLIWFSIKKCKGQVGENSLYEINKSNAVKLSESIWKIKSEKKSFYEGAVNPVFSEESLEDLEIPPSEVQEVTGLKKASLELKKAEIIDTADLVIEEKIEPFEKEIEVEYIEVTNESLPSEEDRIHWECVAEIHTAEEFPQESVVLEIVDNTYNFLSEISDEFRIEGQEGIVSTRENGNKTPDGKSEEPNKARDVKSDQSFQEELLSRIEKMKNDNISEDIEEIIGKRKKLSLGNINGEAKNPFIQIIDESSYETQNKQFLEEPVKGKPDEQNKVKVFKEKLNELLKNQINNGTTLPRNFYFSKHSHGDIVDLDPGKSDQDNENIPYKSVKTLNKSQMKNKLELLLMKGPPVRPSLSSSFNIKMKDTDLDKNEAEDTEHSKTLPNGHSPEPTSHDNIVDKF